MIGQQHSRAQCGYSGLTLNIHNIQAHTNNIHPNQPVKERLKSQSTLSNFFVAKKNCAQVNFK